MNYCYSTAFAGLSLKSLRLCSAIFIKKFVHSYENILMYKEHFFLEDSSALNILEKQHFNFAHQWDTQTYIWIANNVIELVDS